MEKLKSISAALILILMLVGVASYAQAQLYDTNPSMTPSETNVVDPNDELPGIPETGLDDGGTTNTVLWALAAVLVISGLMYLMTRRSERQIE